MGASFKNRTSNSLIRKLQNDMMSGIKHKIKFNGQSQIRIFITLLIVLTVLQGVHGSSPLSFYRMIRAFTRTNPLRYNGHGNWCGRGGGGPPVDPVDWCCQ